MMYISYNLVIVRGLSILSNAMNLSHISVNQ
jgi:hypothetical protein